MGVLRMVRGFLPTAQHISCIALGLTGLWLGGLNAPVQGITLGKGGQKDANDPLLLAQGPSSNKTLDLQVSLLPSLNHRESVGPTFSEIHLLPDLFLPRYPSFNSQLLDQQLILYSIHLFLMGPPDVLVVGSSRALQGVDPETLQQSLMAQGYPELDIYNFSINGATAQVIDVLLRKILTPDQLPKLVIWADGSRAFNSGRPDRTYTQISQSEGFQQIENGVNPILVHPTEAIAQSTCQDYLEPKLSHSTPASLGSMTALSLIEASDMGRSRESGLLSLSTGKSVSASYPRTTEFCTTDSSDSSFFTRNKATSLSSTLGGASVSTGVIGSDVVPTTELVGYSPSSIDYSIASLQALSDHLPLELEVNGFFPNPTVFEPSSYYQSFPYVAGQYDANYVPFQLPGVQTEATQRLAQAMNERQIPLVVVNLPLTINYLDTTRLNYESQFLQHMQQLAQQADFMFVDLNQTDLAQNQYFADPSHLNEQGARAVANSLARQHGILWPR